MRNPLILFKIYFLFAIILATTSSVWGQVTYYSRSSGNWSDVNNWSVVGHAGAVAPQIPGGLAGSNSTDLVIIASTHSIIQDLDRDMGSLTVGTGTAGTLTIGNDNANRLLTVKGSVTVGATGTLTRNTLQTQGTHLLEIQGDNGMLTNNGIINFTDLTRPGGGWSVVDVEIEIGGNVQLAGTATAGNSSLNDLTINKNNRSVKLGSNWSIAEQLYVQAGYLELGDAGAQFAINGSTAASNMQLDINGVLRIYGTAGFPTGYAATLAGTNGTIEYAGTTQTVAPQSVVANFPNLLVTGAGTKILSSGIIVQNNVTISTGTTLAASTFTIALSGDYTNNGTFTSGAGSVRFVGNINQSISGTANFSNLEISQAIPGTRVLANAPLAVSTATSLLQGILDLGTINTHSLATVTGPGTLALSAVAAGTTTFPAGTFANFLTSAGTGTVEYNGALSYAIGTTPLAYANLKVSGMGIKTLTTSETVTRNLTINTGVDFNTATNTILLGGNFINDGTLSGAGTIDFTNTTANQIISGTSITTFNHLTISKATGLALIASSEIRVNGTLALVNEGNLRLGSNNLTIGPSGFITGNSGGTAITDFSNARMIQQDGTNSSNGSLIREGTSTAALTRLFPVGTGSIYSYAIITQLAATVTGTGSITVKAIPFSTTNNNIVKRYWRIKTSGISSITDARLTFQYDPTEITISGSPTLTVKRLDNNVDHDVVGSFIDNTTTSTFGVNAAGNIYLETEWRMGDPSNFAKTYYSYQSGSWDVPNNWTTDPTGTILQGQPGAGGPNNGDRVTILNGRTIEMASTGKILTSLEIENGAILDTKTFGGHNFGTVRGAGLLRIAVNPVPLGDYLEFVSPVGGTIEYYNYAGGLATNIPFYNNVIMSGTGNKIIGGPTRTITINGNLSVTGGTATIGFGAGNKLTVNILGDVLIATGAAVAIGNDQIHELNFFKNVVLNGSIVLSNAAQYANATGVGAAILTLKGAADNTFSGTATRLDLYRLIIDKGVDQTYILDLNCTNLKLFAPTGLANSSTTAPFSQENPRIEKALWVRNGTLKLGSNINIPRLSTGGNDFFIPEKGAIWLNGATVATHESGATGNTGLTLYGKLRVTSGAWRGNASAGIVYRTISEIIIEGGLVEVTQLRASSGGTGPANNRSAYVQSGGEFIVTGTGENGGGAQFSLDKTSSIFRMSGGIIRVKNATGNGAIDIRADVANYNVTGGLIELTTNADRTHSIQSTAPFYNFTVIKGIGTGNASLSGLPLVVLNDLNINSTAVFNANNLNLIVGGNFTCQGTYTTGTNTTIFNSSTSNQTVTNAAGHTFNNLTIANTFTNGVVTLSGNGTTTVNGSLVLSSGTLNDGGEIVNVGANLSNSSAHTGTGRIRLNNAVATVANMSGSGSGTFTNLELDDTEGVILNADQTINGVFTLTNGILDLGQYNLTFGAAASISVTAPGTTKMIMTAGNRTDGGITKVYNATGSFTYPFGVASKYTPATVTISDASNFGSISISPANAKHFFVTDTSALGYYWEVNNTGFTGTKTLSFAFTYVIGDVNGTESSYIGGFYDFDNPSTWTTAGAVNTGTKTIPFTNVSNIAGEYTAGDPAAFNAVIVYYSRQNGNWETNTTWSTTGFAGGSAAGTPTASNPVLIGDGTSINHTVTVTTNTRASGNLKLNKGSTLDLGVTTGHNFGAALGEKINGNGRLRISSSAATAEFPAGDFGEFIREAGGTVEYYYTSTNFTLPTTSASPTLLALSTYNNLIISPGAGTITFPDINLTLYNDMTVSAGAGTALISNTSAGVGTLNIQHDLIVAGILQFQNGNARIINIENLLQIQSGGTFNVGSANTAVTNTINLNGSMVNNGTFDMNVSSRKCDVNFLGTSDATLTGTGAITDFNRLIVNKGSTQTPLLDVNISNLTLSGATSSSIKALDIQNGTFKLSSSQTLTISSGSNGNNYLIPFTARIWLNGGNMRITTTGAGAGLLLAGTLRIDAGTFYIEGGTTNDNYIEIAGAGSPSLEVNGGELRVGSQIRRANTSTISALRYTQTGGTVTIGTQSAPNSNRALLEVLNNGSAYTMSGGTLVIARQQSGTPTIAALYLQPSSSSVTGGTIQFGSTTYTPTSQNIQVYSSIPLYDVVINATNAPTVTLTVGALTIRNNFTIGTSATFNANVFDLNLQGDFTVNGTYTPGNNTTYFNSTSKNQSLLGSAPTVTFNNLHIGNNTPAGVVSLNINTIVTKTLDLMQGTLDDSDKFINVKGRVNNFSTHISGGTGTGRMIFNGTAQQILSGNGMGVLGNVQLNNAAGVLQEGTATINGVLTFTNGVLDIRSEQLILGSSNSIAGTPNVLSMIKTNGTLSDQGVIKNFNGGTFDFTFPIGTPTKYTPARFDATANGAAGIITVKPVNRIHPSAAIGFDALGYYWNVNSSGFSGLTINHGYTYSDEDLNGSETSYVAARFNDNWASSGVGTVTAASNLITVNGSGAGVSYITGDYTAGTSDAFVIVNTFISAQSGDWDLGSTWLSGTVPTSGAPVVINNNHLVTVSSTLLPAPNSKTTFSLEVRGGARLIINNTTFGHNFGNVSGTGTLNLASGIFPGGAYDQFVSSTGGTVEYTGTGYTLSTKLLYNNLTINSTGTITLPNVDITLRGTLSLMAGILDNSVNNKRVTVQGNLINNSGATAFVGGTGTVQFSGSAAQTIGGTSQTQFASVDLNKAANTVSLSNSITIANNLKFTSGTIVTNAFKVIAGPALSVTRMSGHVVGNFSKTASTTPVLYPVGSAASYLPLRINFSTGSSEITASVRNVNPVTEKGNGLDSNPLLALWTIEPTAFPASASATVIFQYPDNVRQSGFQQNLAFSARWNTATSTWESFRTLSSPSPNEDPSSVTTTGITQFSDWAIFSSSGDVVLPIVLKSFSAVYNNDHVLLTWVTASEKNNDYFIIEKSRDGTTFFPIAKQESKGNYSTDTKYTLRDGEVSSGLTYYRMHQVDFDGTTTYFKIIVVNIGDVKEGDYVIYPNPTGDMVTISRKGMPAHVQVNVYDVAGRMWISRTYNDLSLEHLDLDLTALSAGVYQLLILSEDGPKVIKVMKE